MTSSKASVLYNGETLETFSLRSGTRQKCPLSLLIVEVLANSIRQEKSIGGVRMIKEEGNYICGWYDNIPGKPQKISNKTNSNKKLIEVTGYKVKI